MKNTHIENHIGANVRKYEMARIMGVSVRTIENWMIQRMIPSQKINKIVTFDPVQVRNTINAKYTVTAGGGAWH
jgi:phage terminase Nu1 subunit (DNA packaging protein)|tara:strand:- start:277 stop:498 length:222 start_codon:yes stop_codon:yes gene_type:complete